jgi:hypothetical protein
VQATPDPLQLGEKKHDSKGQLMGDFLFAMWSYWFACCGFLSANLFLFGLPFWQTHNKKIINLHSKGSWLGKL